MNEISGLRRGEREHLDFFFALTQLGYTTQQLLSPGA